jgi:hypothetical protein
MDKWDVMESCPYKLGAPGSRSAANKSSNNQFVSRAPAMIETSNLA